jgi:hypothetical protein
MPIANKLLQGMQLSNFLSYKVIAAIEEMILKHSFPPGLFNNDSLPNLLTTYANLNLSLETL